MHAAIHILFTTERLQVKEVHPMEPIWSELSLERVTGRSVAQLLVESDIPVPAGREAQRILYAHGMIKNDVTHCANGRVQAEGTLTLQLLCLDMENNPFGMRAATQYNHDIAIAEVKEGMRASVKPQLLDIRCTLKDRRIHLDAVAELNTVAEQNDRIRVLSDIAGVENLQKKHFETEIGEWTHLGSNTLRLHEEIYAEGIQHLLFADAAAQIQTVTLEENGAAARGILFVNALYSNENGQLTHSMEQLPFEELIPIELVAQPSAMLHVTTNVQDISMQISENENYLEMDTAIQLNAHCIGTSHITALSDAYAPNSGCTCKQETVAKLSPVSFVTQNCVVQESLRTPEGKPDALRPVFTSARPTVLGVVDHDGRLAVEGLLITSVVYQTDDGTLTSFEEDLPFSCTLDAPYMADTEIQVRMLEGRASGSGHTLNCSFTLEASALLREVVYVQLAVDVEESEPIQRENGIMISFASAGETSWNIGKRYGVTAEQLHGWNPELIEPFEEGCPVLILSASGRMHGKDKR